jgi:hypothetical protein
MKLGEKLIKGRRIFLIWSVLGIALHILGLLILTPWTDQLGVASSPQRQIYRLIFDWWVLKLPISLLGFSIVAENSFWLAPRGRYQEGKNYPIFNTYNYTAIAFMAALFTAAGILNYNFFDLAAAPATIAVTFFNPIIGFFTLWVGGVARALIFGTGNPVFWALGQGPSDGATWLWLGIFFWWFRESTKWGKNPALVIVWWIAVYVIWRTVYMFDIWVWLNPVPALWARMVWFFTQFLPSGLLASVAGLVAAEALIRARARGTKQSAPPKK